MGYRVKIFVVFFLINLSCVVELKAQQTQTGKARRQELKSIREEQWEHWHETKRKSDSTRAAGEQEREAYLKSPLSMEYQESVRKQDSARYAGYRILLDTLPVGTKVVKLVKGNYADLPDKIYEFRDLDSLNLARNRITGLDVRFDQFKHLKFLNIAGNDLSERSIKFDRNDTLEYLNLSENEIFKMPRSLRRLKGLKILKISGSSKNGRSLSMGNSTRPDIDLPSTLT